MLRGSPTPLQLLPLVGIMQNSICNLNVFILRYAGAIFIFTENEGFIRQAEEKGEVEGKEAGRQAGKDEGSANG